MLRNLGRVLRAAHKESTFIPGYPVVINAREVLTGLYRKTLDELQALPADTKYRQVVESFTKFRLGVVEQNDDIKRIESLIKAGQVEELIEQAEEELTVVDLMREETPWIADADDTSEKDLAIVVGADQLHFEDAGLKAKGGHSYEDLEKWFRDPAALAQAAAAAAAPPAGAAPDAAKK